LTTSDSLLRCLLDLGRKLRIAAHATFQLFLEPRIRIISDRLVDGALLMCRHDVTKRMPTLHRPVIRGHHFRIALCNPLRDPIIGGSNLFRPMLVLCPDPGKFLPHLLQFGLHRIDLLPHVMIHEPVWIFKQVRRCLRLRSWLRLPLQFEILTLPPRFGFRDSPFGFFAYLTQSPGWNVGLFLRRLLCLLRLRRWFGLLRHFVASKPPLFVPCSPVLLWLLFRFRGRGIKPDPASPASPTALARASRL